MQNHVKTLGILFIVWGIISILVGLAILTFFVGGGLLTGNEGAFALMTLLGTILSSFFLLTGVPEFIGGIGMVRRARWSRIVILVMAVFNVISPPFGTALGIYAFWVLFNPESKQVLVN